MILWLAPHLGGVALPLVGLLITWLNWRVDI